MKIGNSVVPFLAGMAVGVIFNDQIRSAWSTVTGWLPNINIGAPAAPPAAPATNNGTPTLQDNASYAHAFKADFDREYSTVNETYLNGIHMT